MYRWLRNTHLCLGLTLALFLLVYGVSSVQMAHNWFSARPRTSDSVLPLTDEALSGPRPAARELMQRHGMRGEVSQIKESADGFAFSIMRPGTVYAISVKRAQPQASVRTSSANTIRMLNGIHHTAGLWHEYWLLDAWGMLVGLLSVGLVLLALTGIYLWFKIHSERVAGAILLIASLAYSLPLIIMMRLAH